MNLTFLLVYCGLVIASPGPTNLLILSTVHNYGIKKAFEFASGAILGFSIILIMSVLLNTLLEIFLPKILLVLQIAGSIYMLYIAYKIYQIDTTSSTTEHRFASFYAGFMMQFVNPKSILFAMTVFPTFIMPYYSALSELILFAFGIALISTFAFFSWVIFGAMVKTFLEKHQKTVNIFTSLFLAVTAVFMSGVIDLISV